MLPQGTASSICLREKREGGFNLTIKQQQMHWSQIWHQINCHVTCVIFNKGGCSLPLRNKQVFEPQIWCIRGADKDISWYSDQAALEPLCVRQRGPLQHTQRFFWGKKPWLADAPDTKSQNTPWLVQSYGNKGKASGTWKVHSFFFPSIIALQLYLNCHSCSWDCKTTHAGKGKGNPILTYGQAHSMHGGSRFSALKLQSWKKLQWQ